MVAKEASKSTRSSPSASTPASSATEERRMVLRIKSGQGAMNSVTQVSFSSEEDRRLDVKKSSTTKKKKKKKTKTKKKPVKFDSKAPKKPPTAFFFFLEDFRKEYQEQNPDVKNMADVGKACGGKWKTMGHEEKVKYYDIATQKRAEFESAMKEYIKKKESGEQEDSDYDSEDY